MLFLEASAKKDHSIYWIYVRVCLFAGITRCLENMASLDFIFHVRIRLMLQHWDDRLPVLFHGSLARLEEVAIPDASQKAGPEGGQEARARRISMRSALSLPESQSPRGIGSIFSVLNSGRWSRTWPTRVSAYKRRHLGIHLARKHVKQLLCKLRSPTSAGWQFGVMNSFP